MNLKNRDIAAAKALGLKPFKFEVNGISYKGKPFTLTDPACMNMVIEHFKIDVDYSFESETWEASCFSRDFESAIIITDPGRDTAIMKCVTKCLEVESE